METYKCPVCGNTDIHSIGYLNGKPYCRRCISFKGDEVERKPSYPKKAPIHLEYELSREQKELSDKLVKNYKKGIDSLVFAVCGSPKTLNTQHERRNIWAKRKEKENQHMRED